MTTEVLRNMFYAGSPALRGLRWVVLDEVHYLQNAYRGPVWEEVIIHAPHDIGLVCLSATVSNAEELTDWIRTVRGATEAVIEDKRPVELHNLYLVGDRQSERLLLLPTLVDGRPNAEALAIDERLKPHGVRGRGPRGPRGRGYTPWRAEVVELLRDQGMLPSITFIFSRAACDDAVTQCLREGIRLTTVEERAAIRAIAESKVEALSDDDLRVLDYGAWLTGLEAGIAAHHAGMVPPFKEAVEACFAAALVKVVFATETLSLGINMPARSVVIEKLTKFTGERHDFLTPGEYTQLTGRAGRRGIDEVGYAIVLWSPLVPFDQVASLAGTRSYALTSSFRPTYNMAANLVRRYPPETAHHLLNLSFAQYRADADVVRLEAQLEKLQGALAEARERARCDRGDIDEFRRITQEARDATRQRPSDRHAVDEALGRLRPGDVVVAPGSAPAGGRVVVLSTAWRKGGVRLAVVGVDTRRRLLGAEDFPAPPRPVATVALPAPFSPTSRTFQKQAAATLRQARLRASGDAQLPGEGKRGRTRGQHALALAEAAEAHPVATCPDLSVHLRSAARAERLAGDIARLEQRIRGRTESLARQFDRVLRVLEAWGYVDGWALTARGERLGRVYHESDLLVAEALEQGLLDGLNPAEVAALASTFTYEMRGPGEAPLPRFPSPALRERWAALEQLAAELTASEQDAGLPLTRMPDPGFVVVAHGWTSGGDLEDVIANEEMSGGDFVRNSKQLIDLLRQLALVAPVPATRSAAGRAADAIFRGVVAASSVVST
jgi:ATP-dependent RNA helicase HelY